MEDGIEEEGLEESGLAFEVGIGRDSVSQGAGVTTGVIVGGARD